MVPLSFLAARFWGLEPTFAAFRPPQPKVPTFRGFLAQWLREAIAAHGGVGNWRANVVAALHTRFEAVRRLKA